MQVVPTVAGNSCVIVDENLYFYNAITDPFYAQRFTRALLDELRLEFYRANSEAAKTPPDPTQVSSRFIIEVSEKYNNPAKFDKLAEAQGKIGEVAIKIQEELRKVSDNNRDVNVTKSV